jgi:hypothetical protein
MTAITVARWGYDQFEGMSNNWCYRVIAQALDYMDNADQATVLRALRSGDATLLDKGRNRMSFEYDGGKYLIMTASLYEAIRSETIDMLVDEAEDEADQLMDSSHLSAYLKFDREMYARDLQYEDGGHLISSYDGRVDELGVCFYGDDGKIYRADSGPWYIARIG